MYIHTTVYKFSFLYSSMPCCYLKLYLQEYSISEYNDLPLSIFMAIYKFLNM